MNIKIITSLWIAGATVISGNAYSQIDGAWDSSFSKRIYIGGGGGVSMLSPDVSAVPSVSIVDDVDVAASVMLGFDFSRRLTAELQYADLGLAVLSGDIGIDYSEVSLSGLYYIWNGLGSADYLDYDGLDQRTGLSLYGRAGVGVMENNALGLVDFERKNDAQLILGLGVEYALKFGLGVRAEAINVDADAKFANLSLLYRFGGRKSGDVLPEFELELPPAPAELEVLPPPPPPPPVDLLPQVESPIAAAPIAAIVNDDIDNDGVSNGFDICPSTPMGTPVGSDGCAMFNGTLEGVNFLTGSDTLTDTSRSILDDVSNTLLAYPNVRVSVDSHTDSRGLESNNFDLSRRRALSVVRYLTAQGIPLERLEARAYGESRPIADNETRAGRALNRRVELRTVQ